MGETPHHPSCWLLNRFKILSSRVPGFLGLQWASLGMVQTMVVVVNPMPWTPNDGCSIGLSISSWLTCTQCPKPQISGVWNLTHCWKTWGCIFIDYMSWARCFIGWYGLAESRQIFHGKKYAMPVWKWCLVGCHPILLKSTNFFRPIPKMSTNSSPKSGFGVSDCSQEPKVSLEKRLSSWLPSRSPKIYSQVKHGESGFFYFLS